MQLEALLENTFAFTYLFNQFCIVELFLFDKDTRTFSIFFYNIYIIYIYQRFAFTDIFNILYIYIYIKCILYTIYMYAYNSPFDLTQLWCSS